MDQSKSHSKLYWAWIPVLSVIIGFAACNQESTKEDPAQTETGATQEQTLNAGQVDEMPEMQGGMEALMNFMMEEVKYPESMKEVGTEAKVVVEFTVKADGTVGDIHAIEGDANDAFKEEAVRAVSSMPNWEPGTKEGKPVAVKMVLPINFMMKP